MQTLDVISINIWQMVASLLNLLLLFLIIKKFLYKPVKKMLENRQKSIENDYNTAEQAKQQAMLDKKTYEDRLSSAKTEADNVIRSAVEMAHSREDEILTAAKEQADIIVRQAEVDADLEKKRVEDEIKREIVEVGTQLAEKMLEREISADDHKRMIDSFIAGIGDENDRDE